MTKKGKSLRTRLNTRGVIALQTVIIIAVLALGAAGGGIIIYNVVADKTEDLSGTDDAVEEFTAIKKDKIEDLVNPVVPELGDALDPNDPNRQRPEDSTRNDLPVVPDENVDPGGTGGGQTGTGRTGGGQTGGGQTGTGGTGGGQTEEEPSQIVGPVATEFKQISALSNHTCVIKGTERRVWCWGNNSHGQLGNGEIRDNIVTNFTSPVALQAITLEETNIQSVSAGHQLSCALLMDKTIKCWGENQNGQLGVGTAGGTSITPVTVVGINTATSVIAGVRYACAVLEDKTAKCWGNNHKGQFGNGVLGGPDESFPSPETVGGATPLGNIVSIAIGSEYTCAVLEDKTARCWGRNGNGQLGIGRVDTASIPNPVTVLESAGGEALGNIASISAAGNHTCALLEDKTARCWGLNTYGQLGDGTTERRTSPVTVLESPGTPLGNIASISVAGRHTCALLEDKTARCWGFNFYGELGNGTTSEILSPSTSISAPTPTPTTVLESPGTPLGNIASISTGGNHACVILEDETARCWGFQIYGAVGNGWQNGESSEYATPVTETPADES